MHIIIDFMDIIKIIGIILIIGFIRWTVKSDNKSNEDKEESNDDKEESNGNLP